MAHALGQGNNTVSILQVVTIYITKPPSQSLWYRIARGGVTTPKTPKRVASISENKPSNLLRQSSLLYSGVEYCSKDQGLMKS